MQTGQRQDNAVHAIKRRRGRPRIDREVRERVEALAATGLHPKEIRQRLFGELKNAPSQRSIQRILGDSAADRSGVWSLADVDDDSARFVFDVLAAVITTSSGRQSHITKNEALWIGRLWRVAPDLDPWDAYALARSYMARERREESTSDLDEGIAFRSWTKSGGDARASHLAKVATQRLLSGGVEAVARGDADDETRG